MKNKFVTIALFGCAVTTAFIAGYCIGDFACESKISRGMAKIFGGNPELEKEMFKQLDKMTK